MAGLWRVECWQNACIWSRCNLRGGDGLYGEGVNVQLAAGVEIDLATRDDLDQLRQDLNGAIPVVPRRIYAVANIVGGLAGSLLIEVDHPATPVIWDLRSLVVLGSDDHTVLSGVTAAIYVGGGVPGQTPSLLNCMWQGLSVPSSSTFNEQIIIGQNERLFVLLEGTNTNTQYVVTGLVIEVPKDQVSKYLG